MGSFKKEGSLRRYFCYADLEPNDFKFSGETLKAMIYYHRGGINMFTYKTELRGYYFSIFSVKLEPFEGGRTESHVMGNGVKILLRQTPRYYAHELDKLLSACEPVIAQELAVRSTNPDFTISNIALQVKLACEKLFPQAPAEGNHAAN